MHLIIGKVQHQPFNKRCYSFFHFPFSK